MSYYHNPPRPVSTRVQCPVCHQSVYSNAGIHPQCAAHQTESLKPKPAPEPVLLGVDRAEAILRRLVHP